MAVSSAATCAGVASAMMRPPSPARAHLNDAIRIRYDRKIMLDDDYRMARIRQLVQLGIEQVDISWVQARGGLVQQIDRVAATRLRERCSVASLMR